MVDLLIYTFTLYGFIMFCKVLQNQLKRCYIYFKDFKKAKSTKYFKEISLKE
jgi:hypothetical protein